MKMIPPPAGALPASAGYRQLGLPDAPILRALPDVYAVTPGGAVEESGKANAALLPIRPAMVVLMLTVIMLQTGSFRLTGLVFATAPLWLVGAVRALCWLAGWPFGFTGILGLIGLDGILMRNTLILVDQFRGPSDKQPRNRRRGNLRRARVTIVPRRRVTAAAGGLPRTIAPRATPHARRAWSGSHTWLSGVSGVHPDRPRRQEATRPQVPSPSATHRVDAQRV